MKEETTTSGKKEGQPFVSWEPKLREDFTETALDLNMEMVYVEGGEFVMGATPEQGDDAYGAEEPVRTVKLDGYHIGKYPVTQAQWKAVMGTDPSYFKGDNRPVENVTWFDALEFCEKLSEQTGKEYMLPTEAQWEYAARGGNRSKHYKYAGSNDIDEVAWYRKNSGILGSEHPDYGTHPVGMKKANELGIFDMSGNVREWCLDWLGKYNENDTDNPQGPANGGYRVTRGGDWAIISGAFFGPSLDQDEGDSTPCCRVSARIADDPEDSDDTQGFRVACCSKEDEDDFTETAFGLNMEMVYVEGGEFEMGDDTAHDEKPVRTVRLDGYHIGKYAVTQAQWKAVMGETLEEQRDNANQEDPFDDFSVAIFLESLQKFQYGKGENYPMYDVSWEEAQEFCRRLSEAAGRRYMLPTEAQWEYAARGGKKSRHYKYAGSNDPDDVAWCWDNSDHETHPVGMKKSNELGINDMSGNVWEWCSDWYGKYDGNDTDNPQGPVMGSHRVLRGGSWSGFPGEFRVSGSRGHCLPDHKYEFFGFRVVCIP